MGRKKLPLAIRFWRKVKREDTGEICWEWIGCKTKDGYGILSQTELTYAHRISWTLHFGTIPEDMHVLHSCDNPSCVNPSHLFLGNQDINMRDKTRKGRQVKGEKHGMSKLTEEQVREIRNLYEPHSRKYGCPALAKRYGVNWLAIYNVVNGITWKYLLNEDSPEQKSLWD